jgi:hypothetical protein
MAEIIPPSLRSSLERLKNAGAVNGLMLGWRRQVIVNLLPYEEFRAQRLLDAVHDARDHFASGGDRTIQTFWFGYDTVHILVALWRETMVVMLHARAEEADFLRGAVQTFLEDTQLVVESLLSAPMESMEETPSSSSHHEGELGDDSDPKTNFTGLVT